MTGCVHGDSTLCTKSKNDLSTLVLNKIMKVYTDINLFDIDNEMTCSKWGQGKILRSSLE